MSDFTRFTIITFAFCWGAGILLAEPGPGGTGGFQLAGPRRIAAGVALGLVFAGVALLLT